MNKILNYLQNYVEIKITGYKPQLFINICLKRRILIWNIKHVNKNEFTLCMRAADFRKNVRSITIKAGVNVEIINKIGVIFKIRKYKKRKVFVILSILMIALFFYLNSCIWNITIQGGNAYSQKCVLELIDDMGIKKGSLISKINTRQVAEQLLINQKNLSWVGIKRHGTTLKVEIVHGTFFEGKKGDDIPSGEACDIAVSKDCLLYKVTVEDGIQVIETGNTVLAGQRVVMGEGRHAKGEVLGCVWYKAKVPVDMSCEKIIPTGDYIEDKSLLIFGIKLDAPKWRWLPWNWNKPNFKSSEYYYEEKYPFEDIKLPIGIGVTREIETYLQEYSMNESEAKMYAESQAQGIIDSEIPNDARIIKTSGVFKKESGKLYYYLTAEVLENVGIAVKS